VVLKNVNGADVPHAQIAQWMRVNLHLAPQGLS